MYGYPCIHTFTYIETCLCIYLYKIYIPSDRPYTVFRIFAAYNLTIKLKSIACHRT